MCCHVTYLQLRIKDDELSRLTTHMEAASVRTPTSPTGPISPQSPARFTHSITFTCHLSSIPSPVIFQQSPLTHLLPHLPPPPSSLLCRYGIAASLQGKQVVVKHPVKFERPIVGEISLSSSSGRAVLKGTDGCAHACVRRAVSDT